MNSLSDGNTNPFVPWRQKGFLIVTLLYVVVHGLIWIKVDSDVRVRYAGDGTTWYEPAVGLYTHGAFVHTDNPEQANVYRPPVFPIFAAAMFHLFGEATPNAIAFGQIILLFLAGCIFRDAVERWLPGRGLWGMALFLFNPNVLTIAQYTQSDTVFLFFITAAMWSVLRFAQGESSWRFPLLAGAALALACMTRPTAQFLIVALPVALPLISLTAGRADTAVRSFGQGAAAAMLACIMIAPWAIHVHSVDGRYGLSDSQSRHRFLWDQIIMVEAQSQGLSYHEAAQRLEVSPDGPRARFIAEYGENWSSLDERGRYGYLTDRGYGLLLSYPLPDLVIAYSRSVAQFLTAGGTGRLRYLLISDPGQLASTWFTTKQGQFLSKLFGSFANTPPLALAVSVICLGFVAVARVIGLVGLYAMVERRLWPLLTVLTGIIAYFAFVHLFVGNSRYRVVTEPALIFLFVLGLDYLYQRWQGRKVAHN